MNNIKAKLSLLEKKQSIITSLELRKLGATAEIVEKLIATNVIEIETQGIYSLTNAPTSKFHTEVKVTTKYTNSVICLANALAFHECTTQMPKEVIIAIPLHSPRPDTNQLPIQSIYMHPIAYSQGISTHIIEGRKVKIYNLAKTIVDCFEFNEFVGMEVAFEAVEESLRHSKVTKNELLSYAKTRNFTSEVEEDFTEAITHPEKIFVFI